MSREGKLHLVESCSFSNKYYKNVTNEASYKSLKEAAQKFHKKPRISEAVTVHKMQRILRENKIDETVQARVLEGLQEAGANIDEVELWQFPISKINTKEKPNLNGRVYNEQLWRNVIDKQVDVWKGGTGLANHPADDEDGDFMNQSIVWLDGFIGDDGFVYGIGTFVGDGGALARQIIGVGGRIGFSSSGYGDFLNDGITVDPDSYEIDRLADLVLNPSQGVFGDYSDAYSKRAESKNRHESVQLKSKKALKENVNMDAKKTLKEEDKNIKAIAKAVNAADTVEQLTKIADEMGLEVHLQEGATEDITGELTTKLIAKVVSEWKEEDFTPENIEDVQNSLTILTEKGIEKEDAEKLLKDALDEFGVDKDLAANLFKEKQEEAEEEETEDKDSDSDAEKEEESTEEETSEDEDASEEDADEDTEIDECLDEEDLSLEDQLMIEHYSKSLKAIEKKPSELWEEKIQELDTLTAKLKETKLTDNVKAGLNKRTQKLVDNIMKEARAAIQEGFKAKKICEALGIGTIAKLSNVKEKLEDFVALEECLGKATKEANKYKALYEAKSQYAIEEATDAYNNEQEIESLKENIKNLETQLQEAGKSAKAVRKEKISAKVESLRNEEALINLKENNKVLESKYAKAVDKYNNMKDLLAEAKKTIVSLKQENLSLRRDLNESKERSRVLSKSLSESRLQKTALSEAKAKLEQKNKELNTSLLDKKKAEATAKVRRGLQEAKARGEKAAKVREFYDSSKMFRNSKGIDAFLEDSGVTDKSAYTGVKTLREAENKLLFSTSILNESADKARDEIDVPREDVKELSDLFKED